MRRKRIAALLMAVLMALSIVTAASAGKAVTARTAAEKSTFESYNNRTVQNGETASFELMPNPYQLIERMKENSTTWNDILFDFAGKLTAKSSVKWITVKNGNYGFTMDFARNETAKVRSGKVTVTGKGFKAVLKFKQYGKDTLTSVRRSKNKVTVKVSQASGSPYHFIEVAEYYTDDEGIRYSKSLMDNMDFTKTSVTFKVKAGRQYSVYVGTTIPMSEYWRMEGTSDSVYFTPESVTGTEVYR